MRNAILWDNDGVLVNSEVLFYEANRRYFLQHGIELSADLFFEHFLCSSAGIWHMLGWNVQRIANGRRERNNVYAALLDNSPDLSMPGIEGVLQHFATTCRMAVVTSSARDHFERIHERTSLLRYFELVVAAGDYVHEKPDPEPYLVAVAQLKVVAQNCIAVEDSPRGLKAAISAGLDCIILRSQLTEKYSFEGAFAIVDSPAELREVLQGWHEEQSGVTDG